MPGANLRVRTEFLLPRDALEKWGAGVRSLGAPQEAGEVSVFGAIKSEMTHDVSGVRFF